jgi:hypothetical protein
MENASLIVIDTRRPSPSMLEEMCHAVESYPGGKLLLVADVASDAIGIWDRVRERINADRTRANPDNVEITDVSGIGSVVRRRLAGGGAGA